jgi:RNA polymerase sigma-70 factor (ECF subfamily)
LNERDLRQHYERYSYLVFRRCRTLLQSRADAEDAMQEVFVRAQQHTPKPDEAPLAWLYTVATNVCIDLARRRSRATPTAPDALAEADFRVVGSSLDGDRVALVGRALRELPEDVCQIGLLHYLGGLTQEEIGVERDLSRKTVGKKLGVFDEALKRWAAEVVS